MQKTFEEPHASLAHGWFDRPTANLESPPATIPFNNGHSVSSGLQHASQVPDPTAISNLHKALFPPQQNWQWHHLPPPVSGAGRSASDTSTATLDSGVASTMASGGAVEPAGTHSNPIPSSVISRPLVADYNPAQHQQAPAGCQDGSVSQPLNSSILSTPRHYSDPSNLHLDQRTPSGQMHSAASMPMGFVPTAQAPSPPRRSPNHMLKAAAADADAYRTSAAAPSTPNSRHAACPAVEEPSLKRSRNSSNVAHTRAASATKPRSSRFRGVTKHRRSGRWESHIWVKELGRQVYLGGYEHEEHAAEAYDVAALKCKGFRVKTNFDAARYSDLTECMDSISLEELIMAVRRQSQGFSRGTSTYRGVTHHPSGRWEARIGIPGSKHIYLGLFNAEKEAAQAYDRALVRLRGTAAATNFALSDYRSDLAEYHRMQQTVLQSNKNMEDLLGSGQAFERWIKMGSVTPSSAAEAVELPVNLGTTAALHDELRAVTRRRSRTAAEADDEEEDEAGAAEADDPEEEHTSGWLRSTSPVTTRSRRTVSLTTSLREC